MVALRLSPLLVPYTWIWKHLSFPPKKLNVAFRRPLYTPLLPRVPTVMVTVNTSPLCPIRTHLTFWRVLQSLDLVGELWASPLGPCKP